MPYIPTISPEEAAGPVKELYDRELAGQGYVSNHTRVFSRRPEVLAGWQVLKNAITSGMDPRLYELATVAAATAIRSSYCSLVHGQILATSYYQPDTVASIAADETAGAPGALDAPDTAVVRFARKVAMEADKVSQEDIDELRDLGFSDDDIYDVILAAAARCFFSKVLDATGTLPDAALREMPEQLRSALTVGREIAPQTSSGS